VVMPEIRRAVAESRHFLRRRESDRSPGQYPWRRDCTPSRL